MGALCLFAGGGGECLLALTFACLSLVGLKTIMTRFKQKKKENLYLFTLRVYLFVGV